MSTILNQLGFETYAEYLNSELWKQIRKRVFRDVGLKCSLCKKQAKEIHHQAYTRKNMSGETIADLFPICRECHRDVHFKGEKKVGFKEFRKRFSVRRKAKCSPPSERQKRPKVLTCRRCRQNRSRNNLGASVFCKACRKVLRHYRSKNKKGNRIGLVDAHARECQALGRRGAVELTECVQCHVFKAKGHYRSGEKNVCRACRRNPSRRPVKSKAERAVSVQEQWDNLFQ